MRKLSTFDPQTETVLMKRFGIQNSKRGRETGLNDMLVVEDGTDVRTQFVRSIGYMPVSYTHLTLPTKA